MLTFLPSSNTRDTIHVGSIDTIVNGHYAFKPYNENNERKAKKLQLI